MKLSHGHFRDASMAFGGLMLHEEECMECPECKKKGYENAVWVIDGVAEGIKKEHCHFTREDSYATGGEVRHGIRRGAGDDSGRGGRERDEGPGAGRGLRESMGPGRDGVGDAGCSSLVGVSQGLPTRGEQ